MIQVFQIVKELVTPSRQKAATAKEGRSSIRMNNWSTLRHHSDFYKYGPKEQIKKGVLSYHVCFCASDILWSLKGSGYGINVNMPYYYCF